MNLASRVSYHSLNGSTGSLPSAPRFGAVTINEKALEPLMTKRFEHSQPYAKVRFLQMLAGTLSGLQERFNSRINELEAKGIDLDVVPMSDTIPWLSIDLVDRADPTLRKKASAHSMSLPFYGNPDPTQGFHTTEGDFYQTNLTQMLESALDEGEKQAARLSGSEFKTFGEMVRQDGIEQRWTDERRAANAGEYDEWRYRRSLET